MQPDTRPLKIDIVVHGRFYAFDLARELLQLGHDVRVYTNYPKFVAKRFGIPPCHVRTIRWHGAMTRVLGKLGATGQPQHMESYLHRSFGKWAAGQVRNNADLIYVFSGVAEEILRLPRQKSSANNWVVRASAHIREQSRLLCEEERRSGQGIEKPSAWRVEREEREYGLADRIVVVSSFARESFIQHEVGPDRLMLHLLGVENDSFRAEPQAIEARCARILSGRPLKVLTVGSFTARKGGSDLASIATVLSPSMNFQFVGDLPDELRGLREQSNGDIDFHPRVPQDKLVEFYEAADLFAFPTIEDGSPVVLNQAQAAGLPILTTTNCSGPDLVSEGVTGWVVPIRRPDALIDRLRWCDAHRSELVTMVRTIYESFKPRDWKDSAADLVQAIHRCGAQSSNRDAGTGTCEQGEYDGRA